MLHLITTSQDPLLAFVSDDPVRPEIPREFRVSENRYIAALVENNKPTSMVCISLHDFIPESVEDLFRTSSDPTIAVFYTIWSYKSGAGASLLRACLEDIVNRYSLINTFVTLSPKTEMARKFHLKNGAVIFRENQDSVNYRYR
jgi:hypothetical protein